MTSYNGVVSNGKNMIIITDETERTLVLSDNNKIAWKKLDEFEIDVTCTSTTTVEEYNKKIDGIWTAEKFLLVTIRDKVGKRSGCFYGSDNYLVNYRAENEETTEPVCTRFLWKYSDGKYSSNSSGYGVYLGTVDSDDKLYIRARYSSNYSGDIDSTYVVSVYLIDFIPDVVPFS